MFGINTYAKVFEETAYALKDGEYSAPFKTSTAWYIIKRIVNSKSTFIRRICSCIESKTAGIANLSI
jgi:hypothetical protein